MFSPTVVEHLKLSQDTRKHYQNVKGVPFKLAIDTRGALYFPIEEGLSYLNIGSGFGKREGYINVDNNPQCEPDILCDINDLEIHIKPGSMDRIMCIHTIQCLSYHQAILMLKNCYWFLKPEGWFLIQYPDLYAIAKEIMNRPPEDIKFAFEANGGLVGFDSFIDNLDEEYYQSKFCWTERHLYYELIEAGFEKNMLKLVPTIGSPWRDGIFVAQKAKEEKHDQGRED